MATTVLIWLLAAESAAEPALPSLLAQYGPIGIVAAIFLSMVVALHKANQASRESEMTRIEAAHQAEMTRIEAAHQAAIARAQTAYDREVARGDRIESELRDLSKLLTGQLAEVLVRASDAVREALEIMTNWKRQ